MLHSRQKLLLASTDLKNVTNINDVFSKDLTCALLIPTTSKYSGHWCWILKHKDGTVEFGDPYGLPPEDQMKWISKSKRKELGMIKPLLLPLLKKYYDEGHNVIYNNYVFQNDGPDVNDCGRWVGIRLLYKHLPLKQFNKMVNSSDVYDDDAVVTLMSYNKLKK